MLLRNWVESDSICRPFNVVQLYRTVISQTISLKKNADWTEE
jgi:hypothetical protein